MGSFLRLCECVWESLRAFQLHRSVSFSLQGLARGKKSNSSLQPFQTCTDTDLQRHQPDCTVFQINSLLGPHLLLCAPRCLFRLSERCDSLHSDVHSLEYFFSWLICTQREPARTTDLGLVARPPARSSACTPKPRFSNPDPALRQTSPWEHGMIYSAQLCTRAEICELVP